jgi:protein-L-isoaspartate(D-aspartate) O-methyltransferase
MAGSDGYAGGGQSYRMAADALRARMVRRIVARGELTDPAWRAAFAEVPRHLFVVDETVDRPDLGSRLRWLSDAYADRPIATRVVGGELVSSSSQPSLMALMCEALEVADGHRVLEIGTGTGYNAALFAHRLGPDAVTTVDLDLELTGAARARLDAYGTPAARSVAVVTGDGALGHRDRAPYDRIMATCEMPLIPGAWLAQVRPGGRILAPFATGLVALTVWGSEYAEGRFLSTPAFFVALRGAEARGPLGGLGDRLFGGGRDADRTRFGLTVEGGRQWAWRDDPEGPETWNVT